ncbi:MAG: DNA gyrase inhibitor YacG [Myxococcales bacterium]|nr:DNA gyrase inhibitor YacG [Myxococcales bacterium]HRC54537.1 DNA gyrase inhibitor YacG [Kofleriaceae bacterium]
MTKPLTCPTCAKVHVPALGHRLGPFCTPRCQLVDLGRWLSEDYRVPDSGPPPDPGDGSEPQEPR